MHVIGALIPIYHCPNTEQHISFFDESHIFFLGSKIEQHILLLSKFSIISVISIFLKAKISIFAFTIN
jgi:hypothetical protein